MADEPAPDFLAELEALAKRMRDAGFPGSARTLETAGVILEGEKRMTTTHREQIAEVIRMRNEAMFQTLARLIAMAGG